jgi:hypothetical protein
MDFQFFFSFEIRRDSQISFFGGLLGSIFALGYHPKSEETLFSIFSGFASFGR